MSVDSDIFNKLQMFSRRNIFCPSQYRGLGRERERSIGSFSRDSAVVPFFCDFLQAHDVKIPIGVHHQEVPNIRRRVFERLECVSDLSPRIPPHKIFLGKELDKAECRERDYLAFFAANGVNGQCGLQFVSRRLEEREGNVKILFSSSPFVSLTYPH